MKHRIGITLAVGLTAMLLILCSREPEQQSVNEMYVYLLKGSNQDQGYSIPLFPGETSVHRIQRVLENSEELMEELKRTFGYRKIELLAYRVFPFLKQARNQRYFFPITSEYYARVIFLPDGRGEGLPLSIALFHFNGLEDWKTSHALDRLFLILQQARKKAPVFSVRAIVPSTEGIILGQALPHNGQLALFLVLQPKEVSQATIEEGDIWEKKFKEYLRIPGLYYRSFRELQETMKETRRFLLPDAPSTGETDVVPFYQLSVKPKILKRAIPRYPDALREKGVEGRVIVKVLIDEQGRVIRTRILKSARHAELDSAAVAAARMFRFEPGKVQKSPVKVWMTIPFTFRIQ